MLSNAAKKHSSDLNSLCTDLGTRSQIIVVSNRGPVSFRKINDQKLAVRNQSSSAMGSFSSARGRLPLTWVSLAANEADRQALQNAGSGVITQGLPKSWGAVFVPTSRRAYHRFYNVICNPLLWFLHHKCWGQTHTPNIDRAAHSAWDRGFVTVSNEISKNLVSLTTESELPTSIFIRGYHMHLVVENIRSFIPNAIIHYTPGVPWPDLGEWEALPENWIARIHRSLLSANIISFPRDRDRGSFVSSVEELFPDVKIDRAKWQAEQSVGPTLTVGHPSIDHQYFESIASSRRSIKEADSSKSKDSVHTFVMVDRAEPFRNVVRSLRAFEVMLSENSDYHRRVRYVLMLVPPSPHLAQYRRYVNEIKNASDIVNQRFSSDEWRPVELRLESDFTAAVGVLTYYDTLISVPLVDGQATTTLAGPIVNRREGSIIVSRSSVSADVFQESVQIVGATDIVDISTAMERALIMSPRERGIRAASCEQISLKMSHDLSLANEIQHVLSAGKW